MSSSLPLILNIILQIKENRFYLWSNIGITIKGWNISVFFLFEMLKNQLNFFHYFMNVNIWKILKKWSLWMSILCQLSFYDINFTIYMYLNSSDMLRVPVRVTAQGWMTREQLRQYDCHAPVFTEEEELSNSEYT